MLAGIGWPSRSRVPLSCSTCAACASSMDTRSVLREGNGPKAVWIQTSSLAPSVFAGRTNEKSVTAVPFTVVTGGGTVCLLRIMQLAAAMVEDIAADE